MADEPCPPRPMLHRLQLCFKQPNRQYNVDDWLSHACVSLALYSQFVYRPSLGSRKVFTSEYLALVLSSSGVTRSLPRYLRFVQCSSLSPPLSFSAFPSAPVVCCTLSLLVILVLCAFASQTPALCTAIPSAPVMFVARLCLILLYSVIFVLRALPHKHRVCAVLFLRLP